MKNLSIWLPPFSGDYSGVSSALFDFKCLIIIVDAACCTRNYSEYEEPRWTRDKHITYSAQLRTVEAVLGDDKRIMSLVKEAARETNPEFVAILGSPVPAVVGMDMKGMAMQLENELEIPCLGFDTTGFSTYETGISMALCELVEKFGTKSEKIYNGINILGLTPLDFGDTGNAAAIKKTIEDKGLRVIFSGAMNTGLCEVKNSVNAALSLVVSGSGLKAAKYLKKRYGIPYITGVPIGQRYTDMLMSRVFDAIDLPADKCIDKSSFNDGLGAGHGHKAADDRVTISYPEAETDMDTDNETYFIGNEILFKCPNEKTGDFPLLIVHDQIIAASIKSTLELYGIKNPIHTASFFKMEKELKSDTDFALDGESSLVKLIKDNDYKVIIGDPLLKLIPALAERRVIELPHPAVSGMLHWSEVPVLPETDFMK